MLPGAGTHRNRSSLEQEPQIARTSSQHQAPSPYQKEDAQETNRLTTQYHAGQKASWIQTSTGPEATRPPSHPQDSRVEYGEGGPPPLVTWRLNHGKITNAPPLVLSPGRRPLREAPRPGHQERQFQKPPPMRREKPPLDSEQDNTRIGAAMIQSTKEQEHPGSGSSRSRSVPDHEPSDKTGRLALPQHEEVKAEPQVPSSLIDTTDSRSKASSVGPETQGTVPGSTHRIEYRQLSIDGPNTDFNPEADQAPFRHRSQATLTFSPPAPE